MNVSVFNKTTNPILQFSVMLLELVNSSTYHEEFGFSLIFKLL